jgi:hypothetical protein
VTARRLPAEMSGPSSPLGRRRQAERGGAGVDPLPLACSRLDVVPIDVVHSRNPARRAPSLAQLTREWRAQWRAALISVSLSLHMGTSASSLRIRVRRFDSSRGHPGCSCRIHARSTCDAGRMGLRRGFVRPLKTAGARLSRDAHRRAPGARRRNDGETRSRVPLLATPASLDDEFDTDRAHATAVVAAARARFPDAATWPGHERALVFERCHRTVTRSRTRRAGGSIPATPRPRRGPSVRGRGSGSSPSETPLRGRPSGRPLSKCGRRRRRCVRTR